MTAAIDAKPAFSVRLANWVLGIKPLFKFAKQRARKMMIQRAETIGVPWMAESQQLQARDWTADFAAVNNPDLQYPTYYLKPFHAYEEGNLGWLPATEVEVAAYSVHARIWQESGSSGDPHLRQSYHKVLQQELPIAPRDIVDLGCSVGMSTFALQETFPGSKITGVDLSPHFLAVARYRTELRQAGKGNGLQLKGEHPSAEAAPTWVHAASEQTGLPAGSYDLVSACLMFHELPQSASIEIFHEARRLLKPGGYLTIMDMNPRSAVFVKMPPYVMTLLKSTEPYLDEYFSMDIAAEIEAAGFTRPTMIENSPRHRTIIAQVK
ncbi:class I SAM-dependent methyltransferase [Alkalinema sp. FACHB-956]|uniref:class I SAM-dependent methyltransferase n=1 Tax=Alkalinema sp. FACHB-956 TaxID=2692768 RepID=UPI00168586BA|nr:class I SAM-dependent methyltransferase [Alkalinema sp. FACHB-956]MBD2329333.1 class I SAM-dependent methyltransferase [Alkalinema sp. FACHB-956]